MDIHIDKKVGFIILGAVIVGFIIGVCCGSMISRSHMMKKGFDRGMDKKGDYRMMNKGNGSNEPNQVPVQQPTQPINQQPQVSPTTPTVTQ